MNPHSSRNLGTQKSSGMVGWQNQVRVDGDRFGWKKAVKNHVAAKKRGGGTKNSDNKGTL